jgi:hypothetical protein
MKQQAEFTVTPREPPARSFLKRIQDIHDAIARRVQGLFLRRIRTRSGPHRVVPGQIRIAPACSHRDLGSPLEIEWVTWLSAENADK